MKVAGWPRTPSLCVAFPGGGGRLVEMAERLGHAGRQACRCVLAELVVFHAAAPPPSVVVGIGCNLFWPRRVAAGR